MQQQTPPKLQTLDYSGAQPPAQWFSKRVYRAFMFAVSISLVINGGMALVLGTSSEAAQGGFVIVNFPALPCMIIVALLGGPPPGESDMTPFERNIPMLLAIFGSIIWGLLAAMIAKATARRPSD